MRHLLALAAAHFIRVSLLCMTQDELIEKAVERLRKAQHLFERSEKVPAEFRRLKVDELHAHTIREAVFIRFEATDDCGSIEVVMDSQTGEMLANKFLSPKRKSDDNAA